MKRETVEVALDPPYEVVIGPGALDEWLARPRCAPAWIVEKHVRELHGARLDRLGVREMVSIPRGEAAKEWRTLERILDRLADAGLDRNSQLAVLGGGAACDVGGLAASLYMRGIDVVYCPTTLLAMVDASVGGKTSINLARGKNLVGTFHQPRAVFDDIAFLQTLDDAELRSGLGEVVKTALIEGEELLALVEHRAAALLARDEDALTEVIAACVRTKARIVVADERESGLRKQLNLGHTFAHAIETVAGFGAVPHGIAVACGVALALRTSEREGKLLDPDLPQRIDELLWTLHLPTSLAALRRHRPLPADALVRAMAYDKKNRDGGVRLVLPRRAGEIEVDVAIEAEQLARACE